MAGFELYPQMPGYMHMPHQSIDEVLPRCAKLVGTTDNLSVPMLRVGGVLRPSLYGDLIGTRQHTTDMTVQIFPNETLVVGLKFNDSIAPAVGRPIYGTNHGVFSKDFGDADSVEAGYSQIEAVIHTSDGSAAMTATRARGGGVLLTGVTHEETTDFIRACVVGAEYHRQKLRNAAGSLAGRASLRAQ
jgi:hypothetical protein